MRRRRRQRVRRRLLFVIGDYRGLLIEGYDHFLDAGDLGEALLHNIGAGVAVHVLYASVTVRSAADATALARTIVAMLIEAKIRVINFSIVCDYVPSSARAT